MSTFALLAAILAAPTPALACPGHMDGAKAEAPCPDRAHCPDQMASSDPAACAHKADLVHDACSYTTGMMAQRVLSDGHPWTFTGTLTKFDGALDSHVAAAFTVGPDNVYVVANEVLESLTESGQLGRVALEGRILDVDGVKNFVLTSYAAGNS
jgi:hypothetical protein